MVSTKSSLRNFRVWPDTPVETQNWRIPKIGEFENIFPSKIISVAYNFILSPNISFLPIKGSSCQVVWIWRKKCKIYQHRWLFRSRDEKELVERRKIQKYHQIKPRTWDFSVFLHGWCRMLQVYSNRCMYKRNRTILIFLGAVPQSRFRVERYYKSLKSLVLFVHPQKRTSLFCASFWRAPDKKLVRICKDIQQSRILCMCLCVCVVVVVVVVFGKNNKLFRDVIVMRLITMHLHSSHSSFDFFWCLSSQY